MGNSESSRDSSLFILNSISINNNSSVIEKVLSANRKYFVKRKRRKSFKGKALLLVGVRQGFLFMFSTVIYRRG